MNISTVFISNNEDVSLSFLIEKFDKYSNSYLRINSEDIGIFRWNVKPGEKVELEVGDIVYDLSEVKSVLYKRLPSKFQNQIGDENAPYLNGERRHFLEGLYNTFSGSKWINPYFATHRAERKLFQLNHAKLHGLKTPKTLFTNSNEKALFFLAATPSAIIKPISNGLQVIGNDEYSIYTTAINYSGFENLGFTEVFQTPVLLQERIKNAADIRITIIGESIFPVKITTNSQEVDWRKPEIDKKYECFDLPSELKECLLRYTHSLDLVYAAIDLILTPENEYVFLEINPVGEWAWLEVELGLPISQYLIKELL